MSAGAELCNAKQNMLLSQLSLGFSLVSPRGTYDTARALHTKVFFHKTLGHCGARRITKQLSTASPRKQII